MSKIIQAAGGIVVRGGTRRRFAVVQRSKDGLWVLPRGKLKRNERAIVGAQREAAEETGFRVRVREFLGAITYRVRGRSKVVQFWRMDAGFRPIREVKRDIVAVKWLPLSTAVRKLNYPLEKLFLSSVGDSVFRRGKPSLQRKARSRGTKTKSRRRPRRRIRA